MLLMHTVLSIQVCEDPGMIYWERADPGMVYREEKSIIDAEKYYIIQGRSEGGHLPPGAARWGAAKFCQGFFKIYIRKNFKNSERMK